MTRNLPSQKIDPAKNPKEHYPSNDGCTHAESKMYSCFPPQWQPEPRMFLPKYHPKVEISREAYVKGILGHKILSKKSISNPLKNPKRSRYKRQGFGPAKVTTLLFSDSHLAYSPLISHILFRVFINSYTGRGNPLDNPGGLFHIGTKTTVQGGTTPWFTTQTFSTSTIWHRMWEDGHLSHVFLPHTLFNGDPYEKLFQYGTTANNIDPTRHDLTPRRDLNYPLSVTRELFSDNTLALVCQAWQENVATDGYPPHTTRYIWNGYGQNPYI